MRLLLVSSEFPPGPGGIGTHAYHLASQLHRLDWDITVISPQDYSSDEEVRAFNRSQPFRITRLHAMRGMPTNALHRWGVMTRSARSRRPDILVATGTRAVWLSAVLAKRHSLPWVAVGHGMEFGIRSRWQRVLTRRAFSQASWVVCVSQYTRQQMQALGVHPVHSSVIPNGADAVRFVSLPPSDAAAFRAMLGLDEARLLLTVGSVTERKGQDVVIKALPQILNKIPNVHYLVAGNPQKKAEFELLARKLGVAEYVHFLGQISQETLLQCLNACDVFVMTSKHTRTGDFEGYGIAVIEAAMCGKPAVVADNSGLVEAIVDGETGLVVPEGDSAATAEAVVRLLKDDRLRTKLGKAAQHRARTEQTWEYAVSEYDRLLRRLVAQHRAPAHPVRYYEVEEPHR